MEPIISVASYNTSWVSDLGIYREFASEKNFLHELFNDTNETNKRKYFENAINLALNFWNYAKTSGECPVIGFQEMNSREEVIKFEPTFLGGTDYIIEKFPKNSDGTNNFFYRTHFVKVKAPQVVPGLLTIWDKKLGECTYYYESDLDFENNERKRQQGRPILIVFTNQNYILINLHGPNFPFESSQNNMQNLRNEIKRHLETALQEYKKKNKLTQQDKDIISNFNIFIMGDFNDSHNSINQKNPLILYDNEYCYSNGEEAPKSCCYNFNSACEDDLFIRKDEVLTKEKLSNIKEITGYEEGQQDEMIYNPGECAIIKNENNPIRNQGPNILKVGARSLGERGKIVNYRFTGDYVLGLKNNIIQNLQIYKGDSDEEISTRSDHEMVYAKFKINKKEAFVGGKLRFKTYKKTNKKIRSMYNKNSRKIRKIKNIQKTKKNKKTRKNLRKRNLNKTKINKRRGGGFESGVSLFGIPLLSQSSNTIRYDPTTGESKPVTRYSLFGFPLPFQK